MMQPIIKEELQPLLQRYEGQDVYIHIETTNGMYASHFNEIGLNAGTFLRNIVIRFEHANIMGDSKEGYRIGLKLAQGWVYVQGLTHYLDDQEMLIIHGINAQGQLASSLQLSMTPFNE